MVSGADHHDFHHMAFVNNFSTSFRWLDALFGTDDKYRAYKKRLAAARSAASSEAEALAAERKLVEESEKAGFEAEAMAEAKKAW